jgi:hypothetical protein
MRRDVSRGVPVLYQVGENGRSQPFQPRPNVLFFKDLSLSGQAETRPEATHPEHNAQSLLNVAWTKPLAR